MKKMTNRLALINIVTNICENISLDDRPAEDITLDGFLVLDWEEIGGGRIGDIWDGEKLVPVPPVVPAPTSITRRQCALQLRTAGMITMAEAKAMTKDGTPPTSIQGYFDQMTAEQKDLAEIDFAAVNYYRENPLITALMTANGLTEADIDNFFIAAAQL